MVKALTNHRLSLIAQVAVAVASVGSYMGSQHTAAESIAVAVIFSGLIALQGWVSYRQEENENRPWVDPFC